MIESSSNHLSTAAARWLRSSCPRLIVALAALRVWVRRNVTINAITRAWARFALYASLYVMALGERLGLDPQPWSGLNTRAADEALDALDAHLRAQPLPRRVAPPDFTAGVMARVRAQVAPSPAFALTVGPRFATSPGISLLGPAGVIGGVLGFWALVVLGASCLVAVADPAVGVAVLTTLLSAGSVMLTSAHSAAHVAGALAGSVWLLMPLTGALLALLLFAWSRVARQLAPMIQEA